MSVYRECDLTTGEMLRIYRRRIGLSRAALGARLKETRHWVGDVERGTRDMDRSRITWHGSRELTGGERCWVYRTRAGVTQRDVAAELGVSRLWVNKMEKGLEKCDQLLWHWEA